MCFHYAYSIPWVQILPFATLGRQMLLVMSAYFATEILSRLNTRWPQDSRATLKQFYRRRWIRLYPVYALVILGGALALHAAGDDSVLQELPWHLGYASNMLIFGQESWNLTTGHLWTLSAIEQFYLIWPALFLVFGPHRAALAAWGLFWAGAISLAATAAVIPLESSKALVTNCFPFLATGALVSLYRQAPRQEVAAFRWFRAHIFPGILLYIVFWAPRTHSPFFKVGYDLVAAVTLAAILTLVLERSGRAKASWSLSAAGYVGQTSFIIYLIHPLVLGIFVQGFTSFAMALGKPLLLTLATALTIGLSALLHEVLEKPFMNMRGRTIEAVPRDVRVETEELVSPRS
ncbi:hypothetical protein DB347_16385 [Opitutaceae bacterium EW11]|nr:hypothetical protein DB347_16385 [Opitutaceae bacterium EW11]